MNKNYVQQYAHLETTHWWFIIRKKIILQILKKYIPASRNGSLKILNAGAAAGESSKWLSAFGEVTSLENDPVFLEHLYAQDIPVIKASVTSMPFNENEFDLVCAFDVIEHVADDNKAIQELQRVCKPAGKICITVPAFKSLWSIHDEVNGHQRRYTKKQLKILVNEQPGNNILYTSYFNTLLFLPVYLVRRLEKVFRKKSNDQKSDFEYYKTSPWLNTVLKKIFDFEFLLLKLFRLPFGVSLLMLIEKAKSKSPS